MRIFSSVRTVFTRIEQAQRRHRDYQPLMSMSEHELTDIGLTRGGIASDMRHGRRSAG